MSWLKQAFTVTTLEPDSHYVVVDPIQFYEWRHKGVIPINTKCSRTLPPSQVFTEGLIIATIQASEDKITNSKLNADVNVPIVLKVGYMPSMNELIHRFHDLDDEYKRKSHQFKQTCLSQQFVILDDGKDANLYRVIPENEQASLQSFGTINDIMEKFHKVRAELEKKTQSKTGRAFEMADWRRVENLHLYLTNKDLPIDASKVSFLLHKAETKPQSTKIVSWANCYATLNPEAKEMHDRMQRFRSLEWVNDFDRN